MLYKSLSGDALKATVTDEQLADALSRLQPHDLVKDLVTFHTPVSSANVLDAVAELMVRLQSETDAPITIKHYGDSHSIQRPTTQEETEKAAYALVSTDRFTANAAIVKEMRADGITLCTNCGNNYHWHRTPNEAGNCDCECRGWE